jgi:hypothetical protein
MLQTEEASTGEEGALKMKATTAGLQACATERKSEDGCSMGADAAVDEKAGLSEVLDQGADATVVADEMTDEEDDDVYSPFDQGDDATTVFDYKMVDEEEDVDDCNSPFDYSFLAESKTRHEEDFEELLADVMI